MAPKYDRTQLLGHAVIRQAVLDLFSGMVSGAEDEVCERRRAMRFLTATGDDDWAHARAHWCSMADVDPGILRDEIVRVLDGERDIELEDQTYRLNGHDIARRLWSEEKGRHLAYLDRARQVVDARRTARQVQETAERERRREERMRQAWDEANRLIEQGNRRLRYAV